MRECVPVCAMRVCGTRVCVTTVCVTRASVMIVCVMRVCVPARVKRVCAMSMYLVRKRVA